MKLTKEQRAAFYKAAATELPSLIADRFEGFEQALLKAYPDEYPLKRMARLGLGENLKAIAGGETLEAKIFNLIEWAETKGQLVELLQAAETHNPDNPELQTFIADLITAVQTDKPDNPTLQVFFAETGLTAGEAESNDPTARPFQPADEAAYLTWLIGECHYLKLPYAQSGATSLPLEQIYVALKADRSAPAERKASREFFERQVRAASAQREAMYDDAILNQIARFNPMAARLSQYQFSLSQAERARLAAEQEKEAERTYHLAEIIRQYRWLVLLGDPGSGKSTLARWLALQLSRARQNEQVELRVPASQVRPDGEAEVEESLGVARLPVLIRLADYAEQRWPPNQPEQRLSLLDFVAHLDGNPTAPAMVRHYLAAGQVTMILDGLDEVSNPEQRHTIVAGVEELIQEAIPEPQTGMTPLTLGFHPAFHPPHPLSEGNQIVVTSRIVGYYLRPLHENLPHFVIQPMDDQAVRCFCHNWSEQDPQLDGEALSQAVLEHANPYIRTEMGRNPLMLTILAQIYQNQPEAGLPNRRATLYERAARTVFRQRHGRWRPYLKTAHDKDVAEALYRITASIAWQLHSQPENYPAALVDEGSLRRWLDEAVAEEPALLGRRHRNDVVQSLLTAASNLTGFLVARGKGVYGFLHRQFQEYFAARYLAEHQPTMLTEWQTLSDPHWREVLLLAIGIIDQHDFRQAQDLLLSLLQAPDPTEGLLPFNLLFASTALAEMSEPSSELIETMAHGLIQAYRRDEEHRFNVLHERLEKAFDRLPHADPVEQALVTALATRSQTADIGREEDPARLTRLAALELILKYERYTPTTVKAMLACWPRETDPPIGHLLTALSKAHEQQPALFEQPDILWNQLPFRRAMAADPDRWAKLIAQPHWAQLLRALYLNPMAEELTPANIHRDSPLTPQLLPLIQANPAPAELEALLPVLQAEYDRQRPTSAWRDSLLILSYLAPPPPRPRSAIWGSW